MQPRDNGGLGLLGCRLHGAVQARTQDDRRCDRRHDGVAAWRRGRCPAALRRCGVAAWRRGSDAAASGSVAARRRCGAVARRRGGVAARWRSGAVARWRGGAVAWRRGGVAARIPKQLHWSALCPSCLNAGRAH